MNVPLPLATVVLVMAAVAVVTPVDAETRSPTAGKTPPALTLAQVQASTAEARRLSDAFVAVADRASPSVVQVDVTVRDAKADALWRMFGRNSSDEPVARGMGSGVVFTGDGAIVTNNHVVEEALTINVRLRDGRYLPAKLIGRDPSTDLAVVQIDAPGLVAATFADSDAVRVGEWVVAIGSPFGLGYSVTAGVLSAKGRGGLGMNAIEDYLQTDASINPGNSGGPLCNLQGDVIGINTMIVGRGQGIGFAVPSAMVERVASQLLKTGHVSRSWLGVAVQDLSPELAAAMHVPASSGALVNNVAVGGPAQRANLRAGDIIAAVGGRAVHDGHELVREAFSHEVGKAVELEIVRGGQHYATSVTLSERPEPPVEAVPAQRLATPNQGLGLVVRDLPPQQAAQVGLPAKPIPVVTQVAAGSTADREGLRVNDIIVEANGVAEPTSAQVADMAKSGNILVRVRRGDAYYYAALTK
ncbi:MAG: trypsin-like peptidase domain-containing protein [Polyangiaceae bacterium]